MNKVGKFINRLIGDSLGQIDLICEQRDDLSRQVSQLSAQISQLTNQMSRMGELPFVPNGHFYSPIPSKIELNQDYDRIFPEVYLSPSGINFRAQQQVELLKRLSQFYRELPFGEERGKYRYGFSNSAYSWSDAICLNAMLRHVRPKRVVEVGSGHSSCMTLDTNEIWFNNAIECTFIEPYPELLFSLLRDGDRDRISILPSRVQDVDLEVFRRLEENDILFIDSTHVSKTGSDVNRLYFDVLPSLAAGVYVHIHDVFHKFEYPPSWVIDEGRAWNEQYILRALLQDSNRYEIILFNDFLAKNYRQELEMQIPNALRNTGGSIWLRVNNH